MENREIYAHVDHTLLKPDASWCEIEQLCREAVAYQTASVCVPPSYVGRIARAFPALNLCTVAGFPLGYLPPEIKYAEAEAVIAAGADEVDMVINLGDVKNGDYDRVTQEIAGMKTICADKLLKVIIETCYLTEQEKIILCGCVTNAGADYIKTSTGFGPSGAVMADIRLFKQHIGPRVKIKAAGGIRSREDMVAFIEAGCGRLGTSSAVKLLSGEAGDGY